MIKSTRTDIVTTYKSIRNLSARVEKSGELGWVVGCSLGGERWDGKEEGEEEGETEEESVSRMMWNLVGGRKRQFPTTFKKKTCSNSDGNNDISSKQELEGYPPRPPAALLSILAISRALVIQMLWKCMGGKIRWLPKTIMKKTLPNLDCINVISSSQNAWVLLSTKSTKSIVGHYINNQLPNE